MNMRAATPEEELRKLIMENPDLQLVPMCTEECGNPYYGHTMCKFRSCRIDEWVVNPLDEERILYRSQDFDDFEEQFYDNCAEGEINEEAAQAALAAWNAIPWTRAIMLHIGAMYTGNIVRVENNFHVFEAIQWTGDNLREIIDFAGLNFSAKEWTWEEYEEVVREKGLKIFIVPDFSVVANVGDWILKNQDGVVYPRSNEYFVNHYRPWRAY